MEQDVEYITEEKENGKKNYKIKGIFMQAGIKNKNGRVYPEEILQKEVARYNKEFINENRAYGELGHPEGPTINLEIALTNDRGSSKLINKDIQIKTSLKGEHNIKNILASFAVYYCLGKKTNNFASKFYSKDIKDIRQIKSKSGFSEEDV